MDETGTTLETTTPTPLFYGNGLRKIEIELPDEFGLTKKIQIRSVHIYLTNGNQKIEVSYCLIWSYNDDEVKREIHHFTLDNSNPMKLYLDIWDKTTVPIETELGKLIADGIISWFN